MKMAADFLQSNRLSPPFLTEGLLKRIRRKMTKRNDEKVRKLDKDDQQSQDKDESCNDTQSGDLNCIHQNGSNESNESRGKHDTTLDDTSTCDEDLTTDLAVKHNVKNRKLKAILFNGLIKIPKPPDNPRLIHSPSSTPSSSTREEQATTSTVTENLGTQTRISEETNFPETCVEIESQNHFLQRHITLDQSDLFQVEEPIYKNNEIDEQSSEDADRVNLTPLTANVLSRDFLSTARDSGSFNQQDHTQRLSSEDQDQQVDEERNDEEALFVIDIGENDENEALPPSDILNESIKETDERDSANIQTQSTGMNDRTGSKTNCSLDNSRNNQINQNLSNSIFEPYSLDPHENPDVLNEANVQNSVGIIAQHISESTVTDSVRENPDKLSSKKKQFLNIVHLLFDMRLKRKYKEDDTEPLVEDEFLDDVSGEDETHNKETKDKSSCKLHLAGNDSESAAKICTSPSPSTKKKRRRLRKKTVYRASHRLRKNLGRGCRSISYGFSYLVTEIPPDTPRKGVNGYNRRLGQEDSHEDNFVPEGATPSKPPKKKFISLESF